MITSETYFSSENNLKYMGASQFKSFMKCEAAALAELSGEYEREKTTAFLVGSYVDAHFEGTLDIFKTQNPEIFTQKGTLKADYKQAEHIIARIERSEMFMKYMAGKKQVIMTGVIEGIPVKIKIDSYHPVKAIVDLKIMRDLKDVWDSDNRKWVPYWSAWGYDIQGAIYQEIVRQNSGKQLPFFIAGASKEEETNLEIGCIAQENLDSCMEIIKANIRRYDDLKKSLSTPERCGTCDYCKFTKVLTEIVDYRY